MVIRCPGCEIRLRYRDRERHNCLDTYKAVAKRLQSQISKYETGIAVRCQNGHALYPQQGATEWHKKKYGDVGSITECDNCHRMGLQSDKIYLRCQKECDFDLCHECLYKV